MERIYKLGESGWGQWGVYVKCPGFWQQISPWYWRRGNALRFANRRGITLQAEELKRKI